MTEGERGPAGAGHWRSTALWRLLAAMRVEPEGAGLRFTARLALENGWTKAHAGAVFEEYRRFLYLAATAPAPVTPSEDVDQAWHLHLCYTRHYWDVLCGGILERPLHHTPTEGGPAENGRYRDQYRATLARYRSVFGAPPPPTVWPDVERRFSARPLRIDSARYWLVPKALPRRAAALAATVPLAACTALAAKLDVVDWTGFLVGLMPALVGMAVLVLVLIAIRRSRKGRHGGCGAGGCGAGGCGDGGGDSGSGCSGGGCGGGGCGGS